MMAWLCPSDEKLVWAEKAASQGEREGFKIVAFATWNGEGCPVDRGKALQLYQNAAQLQDMRAQFEFGKKGFTANDWEQYFWFGKSAAQGCKESITEFVRVLYRYDLLSKSELARGVFEIGSACCRQVEVGTRPRHVFGRVLGDQQFCVLAKIIELHDEWCEKAKRAILCWIWVAKNEFGIGKDMRVFVACLIWENRRACSIFPTLKNY